jgi:hypothetical protein
MSRALTFTFLAATAIGGAAGVVLGKLVADAVL